VCVCVCVFGRDRYCSNIAGISFARITAILFKVQRYVPVTFE